MTKKNSLFVFLSVLALAVFVAAFAQQTADNTAVDPVCGMTVVKAKAAATFEHDGTTYYFCNVGCKEAFAKDPAKYLKKDSQTAEKTMMHGAGHMGMGMQEEGACPFYAKDVDFAVEKTADGVTLKITSKNPESVKAIQEHAAMMQQMKKGAGMGMEAGACPGCPDTCPMKKAPQR